MPAIPTHMDVSDANRKFLAAGLLSTSERYEAVTNTLAHLVGEACNPGDYVPRSIIGKTFDHVSAARGLLAASQEAYRLGDAARGQAWAEMAELFLTYAVCDIADIEAVATRYEMGEPQ